ncbi:hypothetical protein [Lacrimispora indolis]|uniref:hypothetical protein n=1 Tax=Lacrimispora indolis TaxID=69825 RepID=UPI0004116EF2|nr:hypothetical protein [[Clostridium] methoxybenzovorans]
MDKYIEVLCKQNPKIKLECNNPECKCITEVKSKDIFKNKEYILTCPHCKTETPYDTTEFVNDFKKQMKALGVTVK